MLSTNKTSRYWLMDLTGIAILFGVFYLIWIGSHPLFTPDEGRYSEVAREMVTTGDYITPRLNGVVFLDKPILYYWLQASAIQLFGLKEAALRLWPALLGIFGTLIVYLSGRILFNRRAGLLSAFILASSPLYYGAAHYANLDLEVAVLVSTSLLSFIVAMQLTSPSQRFWVLMSAYVFAGLAALTKGLIGIVFPAMIIGTWILLLGRWSTLKKMHLFLGLTIFAVITLPWYIMVQKANPEFFQFFFVKQQVSRFLTTDHFNNRTPLWFYIPIVLIGLFPWCVFFLQSIGEHITRVLRNRQNHAKELFLLIWLVEIFIFFSIPKSKTIGYILPVFPVLALLIGNYLSERWNTTTRGMMLGVKLFIAICAAIVIACLAQYHFKMIDIDNPIYPYLLFSAGLFFITAVSVTLLLKMKKVPYFFQAFFATSVVFLLMLSCMLSSINQKTIKPLAQEIKMQLKPDDEIVTYYRYYQDLPIYLERRITIVADWNAPDIALNDNWVRELWYGMPYQNTKDWLIDKDTFWQRWHGNKRLYVFTSKDYYNEIKTKTLTYKIAEYNDNVLFSNQSGTRYEPYT